MNIFDALQVAMIATTVGSIMIFARRARPEAERPRDPMRHGTPYRTADVVGATRRLALRPFGSMCPACGSSPYGAPVYQPRYNRIRRSCTVNCIWNDVSGSGGCGAVWYELPKDAEGPR